MGGGGPPTLALWANPRAGTPAKPAGCPSLCFPVLLTIVSTTKDACRGVRGDMKSGIYFLRRPGPSPAPTSGRARSSSCHLPSIGAFPLYCTTFEQMGESTLNRHPAERRIWRTFLPPPHWATAS